VGGEGDVEGRGLGVSGDTDKDSSVPGCQMCHVLMWWWVACP